VVRERDAVAISDIRLPRETRVVCLYRDDKLILPDLDTVLRIGDEVVLISHRNNMEELARRWAK
jgi:trk system potassium uptake protein TrkA